MKDKVLETIQDYVKDKNVLDVGCIEHSVNNINVCRIWVHDFIKSLAKRCIGIDILKEDIDSLNKQGYEIYCMNAEHFDFSLEFDVIFAGELIEHLSNAGLFLQSCQNSLKDNGYLILTTPNSFNLQRLIELTYRYNNNPIANPQHTCWYSPRVIEELLKRYKFKVIEFKFVDYPFINPTWTVKVKNFIAKIMGSKFKETMIVICKYERDGGYGKPK